MKFSYVFASCFMPTSAALSGIQVRALKPRHHQTFQATSEPIVHHTDEEKRICRVAIIGGGIAGLSCASHLLSTASTHVQFQPVVFDTGRLRPGGRCSSRYPKDKQKHPSSLNRIIFQQGIIDHAAQILTVPSGGTWTAFQEQVKKWEAQGVIKKFPPYSVGLIEPLSTAKVINKLSPPNTFDIKWLNPEDKRQRLMYYGTQGMASIPQAMRNVESHNASITIPIQQDVWISPSSGLEYKTGKWMLRSNIKSYGSFDRVVIAHNGKCAYRLTSKAPSTELHQLLDANFYFTVPQSGGTKMTLNSIYSLTIAVKVSDQSSDTSVIGKAIGRDSFVCAFIKNEPNLKFLTCQTRKFQQTKPSKYEIWTVLSSPKLAKQYKAPQENIPHDIQEEVTQIMLSSLERCLNIQAGILSDQGESSIVADTFLQLWGAAVPINTWRNEELDSTPLPLIETDGFVYDAEFGIGACGDWLLDSSIAGAWESGRRLAKWMIRSSGDNQTHDSVGLPPHGKFIPSKVALDSGIGNL